MAQDLQTDMAFTAAGEALSGPMSGGLFTLQNLLLPALSEATEFGLYYRGRGAVAYDAPQRLLHLEPGARVGFGTYFNAFSLGKWHQAGALEGLFLDLRGEGRVELRVMIRGARPAIVLRSEFVTLQDDPARIDLSNYPDFATNGVIKVEIRAIGGPATIRGGAFLTARQPDAWPRLAISITTFRREKDVKDTAARLESFLASSAFGPHIRAFVVDNGKTLDLPPSDAITVIPNANLGGAGGFARGLKEAEAQGFSHCLFMDDDASCEMEAIHRTYAFLALSRDPKTAVAGAMISAANRWAMWENGAVFDGSCRPQFIGTDLRRADRVVAMEVETADPTYRQRHPTLYGGWWFFAFPIAQVKHYPFPFFVRGDDISFSLANDFHITTLNGVVSLQEDFAAKESPQTLYLDLRNHLVHHLVFERLERSALGTARVAIWFILRSLVRFHYDTAEAQILAWRDVMQGPDFFASHADMAERRAVLKEMTRTEVWQPAQTLDLSQKRRWSGRGHGWQRFFSFVLNGHLLPFWGWLGDRVVIDIKERGLLFPIWGARQITYLDPKAGKGYTVRLSMRRFGKCLWEMARCTASFLRAFPRLRQDYRQGYDRIASREFWDRKFD